MHRGKPTCGQGTHLGGAHQEEFQTRSRGNQMAHCKGVTEEFNEGEFTELWTGRRELRRAGAEPGKSDHRKPLAHLDLRGEGRGQCCWSPWRAMAVEEERCLDRNSGHRVTGFGGGIRKLPPLSCRLNFCQGLPLPELRDDAGHGRAGTR